jgi:hypothetical protein
VNTLSSAMPTTKLLEFLGPAPELDLTSVTRRALVEFRNQVHRRLRPQRQTTISSRSRRYFGRRSATGISPKTRANSSTPFAKIRKTASVLSRSQRYGPRDSKCACGRRPRMAKHGFVRPVYRSTLGRHCITYLGQPRSGKKRGPVTEPKNPLPSEPPLEGGRRAASGGSRSELSEA